MLINYNLLWLTITLISCWCFFLMMKIMDLNRSNPFPTQLYYSFKTSNKYTIIVLLSCVVLLVKLFSHYVIKVSAHRRKITVKRWMNPSEVQFESIEKVQINFWTHQRRAPCARDKVFFATRHRVKCIIEGNWYWNHMRCNFCSLEILSVE